MHVLPCGKLGSLALPKRHVLLPLRLPKAGGLAKSRQAVNCTASAAVGAAALQGGQKPAEISQGLLHKWKAWWTLESPQQDPSGRDGKSNFVPLAKKMLSLCSPDLKLFVFACIFMVIGLMYLRFGQLVRRPAALQ